MRAVASALALLVVLSGCAAPHNSPTGTPVVSNNGVIGTPAPGSKFSKIRIGMGEKEVTDLIGPANDVSGHITGKAFIPFYFGPGAAEVDAHYKGEGILTYESGGLGSTTPRINLITVDRNESGYSR